MYLPKYFHHVYLFICIEIIEKWACPIEVFVDMSHTEHYVTFYAHARYPVGSDVRPPDKSVFSFLSTKTYVVGTQKNRLNEMVLR